jgi:glycosyltransferase involved in cell wall biosynthesis
MKILLLSFYYHPDLSAGSFRATAFVNSLRQVAPDVAIHVVTTLPNRYQSFSVGALEHESDGGIEITRIMLPPHRSGMLDQSKAFGTFARGVWKAISGKKYDLVFATSSRLMTAVLGAWIARSRHVPLYLDIRDIFVDTIKDVLSQRFALAASVLFGLLERWTIRTAVSVNLVSAGFEPYFRKRYPDKRLTFITNGIDEDFAATVNCNSDANLARVSKQPLVVVYAGNIGDGQGLHTLLPKLARRLADRVHFKIFGDGGRKAELVDALTLQGIVNVSLLAPVSRKQLIDEYRVADVLLVHLNDYEALTKVIPSKLFEYAATGKPIWAGVAGFTASFVASEIADAVVFKPGDVDDAINALDRLKLTTTPRSEFVEKFSRRVVSRRLAEDVQLFLRAQ